jgi:thiol:disulfide interchange protein DsbA
MVKYLKLFAFMVMLPFTAMAADYQFEEGKHYSKINTEKSAQPSVTEFFSYYCPHCARFEGVAQQLAKELPAGVFQKNHVNFMRWLSPEAQDYLTIAYAVGQEKKLANEVSNAIFNSIHKHQNRFDSLADVRKFLAVGDIISAEEFDALSASMVVTSKVHKATEKQNKFAELGVLNSVPTFIVNDIYRVDHSSIRSYEELKALIDYLLAK